MLTAKYHNGNMLWHVLAPRCISLIWVAVGHVMVMGWVMGWVIG